MPSTDVSATQDGSAPASLGDLLYDQAMRELRVASPGQVRDTTPETAAAPLRFDLPRVRQDASTGMPGSPEVHAHAHDRRGHLDGRDNHDNRDNRETREHLQRATSGASDVQAVRDVRDTADAPLRRGDIDQVAQRVMRLIAREQRRERESKGRR